jgi:Mor family transcriptional regulator
MFQDAANMLGLRLGVWARMLLRQEIKRMINQRGKISPTLNSADLIAEDSMRSKWSALLKEDIEIRDRLYAVTTRQDARNVADLQGRDA